jgi:hypothetical protein
MRVLFVTVLALAAVASAAGAGERVSIRLAGQVLTSPGFLRVLILVEPDAANRRLTIEVDGAPMFRSSEVTLEGAKEKRAHQFEVKSLLPGEYVVRAVVHGSTGGDVVRERRVIVVGPGMPPPGAADFAGTNGAAGDLVPPF